MATRSTVFALMTALVCSALGVSRAGATSPNRIWVSGRGVDQAGCGTPASPCRSLQYGHDAVAAGGEIDILDPAGYGSITITKAVSIVNDGVGTAGVQAASGKAILIDAGAADQIYLRGLNIDGAGQSGAYGIQFLAGGGVTVVNCVVRHFSQFGLAINPNSGTASILVENTLIADNGGDGVALDGGTGSATVNMMFDHVTSVNNAYGIQIDTGQSTGAANISITDTVVSNNTSYGATVVAGRAGTTVNFDNDSLATNPYGLYVGESAVVHLTRSTVFKNSVYGVYDSTVSGAIYSTGDNRIDANTQDMFGPAFHTDTLK